MIEVTGGHRPRAIRPLATEALDGWRVKHYGIAVSDDGPRQELVDATRRCAEEVLRAVAPTAHGYAFTIAHDAGDFCFALVAWWSGENEIHQKVFSSDLETPGDLRAHPTPAIGCIWELAVHDFERRAWIEHMLDGPGGPHAEAYVDMTFEGVV
jgi:hypothetical protein